MLDSFVVLSCFSLCKSRGTCGQLFTQSPVVYLDARTVLELFYQSGHFRRPARCPAAGTSLLPVLAEGEPSEAEPARGAPEPLDAHSGPAHGLAFKELAGLCVRALLVCIDKFDDGACGSHHDGEDGHYSFC